MLVNQMFQSEWLKPEDLGIDDHPVTIEAVDYTVGKTKTGEATAEYFLKLREFPKKKLGLNRTNAKVIQGIHGDDTDDWLGKRITIYATEGQVFDEIKLVIRVRLRPPEVKKSTVQTLGTMGETKLREALFKATLTLEELRTWLMVKKGLPGEEVMGEIATWPAAWAKDIKGWIDKPEKVAAPKHQELSEEDIPFDFAPACR